MELQLNSGIFQAAVLCTVLGNGAAANTVTVQPEQSGGRGMEVLARNPTSANAVVAELEPFATPDDRLWDEILANTTDEEFLRLEEMMMDDERRYGTMPLDFTGR
jgi:shikimate 5-dehydrogenase